jgi:hypothetical protein
LAPVVCCREKCGAAINAGFNKIARYRPNETQPFTDNDILTFIENAHFIFKCSINQTATMSKEVPDLLSLYQMRRRLKGSVNLSLEGM